MRPTILARGIAASGLTAMFMCAVPIAQGEPLKVLNRTVNLDGSTQLTVGTVLSTEWETKFGMDMGFVRPSSAALAAAPNAPQDQWGSAWASMMVPQLPLAGPFERASIEARVDAFKEEAKVGTSLTRSVPLGRTLSLTMQNGYWLTQSGYALGNSDASATQVWTTDQVVKVKLLPTGTTIAAGAALNSADGQWLGSLSAEQQLYRGLSVSSGISEAPDGSLTKTIKAGFRHTW